MAHFGGEGGRRTGPGRVNSGFAAEGAEKMGPLRVLVMGVEYPDLSLKVSY